MVSSNNLPPKAIINVYWSDGRGKHVSSRTFSFVPTDPLYIVKTIIEEAAKRHGNVTLDSADLMVVQQVINIPINNLGRLS